MAIRLEQPFVKKIVFLVALADENKSTLSLDFYKNFSRTNIIARNLDKRWIRQKQNQDRKKSIIIIFYFCMIISNKIRHT